MGARKSIDTDLVGRRWNAGAARKLLVAWRESGLSLAAFAREHGFQAQRLSWWRKRVEVQRRPVRRRRVPAVAPLTFIPATITGTGPARVTLRLTGGVEVEAADVTALPASWVATLVRALAETGS